MAHRFECNGDVTTVDRLKLTGGLFLKVCTMSKGHRPGQKISKRSLKVMPPSTRCEIREDLLIAYRNSEPGTAKNLNIFKALDAHEKKHGCGAKLSCRSAEPPNYPKPSHD